MVLTNNFKLHPSFSLITTLMPYLHGIPFIVLVVIPKRLDRNFKLDALSAPKKYDVIYNPLDFETMFSENNGWWCNRLLQEVDSKSARLIYCRRLTCKPNSPHVVR